MVTDQQVRRLRMLVNRENTKAIAAAKSGMSEKTSRKYLKSGKMPSEYDRERTWRTRKCPFKNDWDEICGYLEVNPGLEAKTIFEELQRKYSGRYQDTQLRTLQRRIKRWRATEGPAKEVFFPQVHKPGELGAFDFTHMNSLGITIQRRPFNHLLGHFVLTYSNWEWADICYSESYESLSECLQGSLWELGGVPGCIRIDRMSSAVHKDCNPEEFTARYTSLLKHYGARGQKIQAGKANENGDVEQRHYRTKKALEQALMLRGTRDFDSIEEYREFLKRILFQLNAGRKKRLKEELSVLGELPQTKQDASSEDTVTVGPGSTVNIKHNTYSVHSRLIGERIKARVYLSHIEIWYAQKKIDHFPRLRGEGKYRIDYRHMIEWLVRKPGAFENYRYREGLYPNSYFRMAYDRLKKRHTVRKANKEYLELLYAAFLEGEFKVETVIRDMLLTGEKITSTAVKCRVKNMDNDMNIPEVNIKSVDLSNYDMLLSGYTEEVSSNE